MDDVQASLTLNPTSFKALRTRARLHMHAEDFLSAVGDLQEAMLCATEQYIKDALLLELGEAERALEELRNTKQDYYEVLGRMHSNMSIISCSDEWHCTGVSRSCPQVDIKKAYRLLSLKYHPDKVRVLQTNLRCVTLRLTVRCEFKGRKCREIQAHCSRIRGSLRPDGTSQLRSFRPV